MIFIKKFPDILAELAAPSESEVSVYVNPGKSFVEIEQQGAYKELKPGDSLTWEVIVSTINLPRVTDKSIG